MIQEIFQRLACQCMWKHNQGSGLWKCPPCVNHTENSGCHHYICCLSYYMLTFFWEGAILDEWIKALPVMSQCGWEDDLGSWDCIRDNEGGVMACYIFLVLWGSCRRTDKAEALKNGFSEEIWAWSHWILWTKSEKTRSTRMLLCTFFGLCSQWRRISPTQNTFNNV